MRRPQTSPFVTFVRAGMNLASGGRHRRGVAAELPRVDGAPLGDAHHPGAFPHHPGAVHTIAPPRVSCLPRRLRFSAVRSQFTFAAAIFRRSLEIRTRRFLQMTTPTTTYLYGGESRGYLHDLHDSRINFGSSMSSVLSPRSNNGWLKGLPFIVPFPF